MLTAIVVIIFIKAQNVKPFGAFLLASVVLTIGRLLLIASPYENSEQDTGKIKMSHQQPGQNEMVIRLTGAIKY